MHLKLYSITCYLSLLSFFAQAQMSVGASPTATPLDTTYFDQDWERTDIPGDRKYVRIARHTPDGRTSGTVRDYYYPAWKKQWEGKLAQENPDKPQGLCTGWHENGQLSFRGIYANGQAQADYRSWHEDGKLITCSYIYQDALPVSTAKLVAMQMPGSSRSVFQVSLPENTVGIVYKFDIRDEGEPSIKWSTMLALGSIAFDPSMTTASALMAGSKALTAQNSQSTPTVSTKNHWFVTDELPVAKYFIDTKGGLSDAKACYRVARNITQETREIKLEPGVRRLFICVNNDNEVTDATATLSVSALVQTCK